MSSFGSGIHTSSPDGVTPSGSTLIHGGRVIDPSQNLDDHRDVLLHDSRVAAIEPPGALDGRATQLGAARLNASGRVVAPGLVDLHVHLREPGQGYKETIATGTRAAAAGGFTTVCAMPNTSPVNDSVSITRWMQAAERGAVARVSPIAAATQSSLGEVLTDYAALRDAGAVAVSDDGKPILGDDIMRAALVAAAHARLTVIQHAEDTHITGGCSMNAGALAFRLGLRGMPVEAESSIVERDIRLQKEVARELGDTNVRLHVAHLSTRKALDAVREARASGLRVTCEVTPHHFVLTEEAIGDYNSMAKMNPPLRSEADRNAMIEGLLDGTIDAIATDHAPHATHEKEQEFERAPNGITGLETSLGLSLMLLHMRHGMSLARIISLLSTQPAALLGLKSAGSLRPGANADVVVFDPRGEWTYSALAGSSKAHNTPFNNWSLPGQVHATIVGGQFIFRAPSTQNAIQPL